MAPSASKKRCILPLAVAMLASIGWNAGEGFAASEYATPTVVNNSVTSAIAYMGAWQSYAARGVGDYTDDVHATIANNDSFTFTFTGTDIAYIGEKDSVLGNVDIYIDNVFQTTVSCYNATLQSQQTIYAKSGLSPGTHTLKAVKKTGTYMIVDALKFTPSGSAMINNTATTLAEYGISYSGSYWNSFRNRGVGDYRDDVHATIANNDFFQLSFEGTGIDFIAERDTVLGNVDVYIDGAFQTTISQYNSTLLAQQVVYSKHGLTPGIHTIKGVKKSGSYMIVDSFKIYYPAQTTYDDYNGQISYTPSAFSQLYGLTGAVNNTMHWTTTAGASAELSFYGNSVQYVGSKNTDHGFVDIYIDDVLATTVDTYGPSRQWNYAFYGRSWPTSGAHKIKVVAKNQKHASSSSIGFDLDGFRVAYDPQEIARKPLWQGTTMNNESLVLVSTAGQAAKAPLLFASTGILSVRNSRLDIEYVEGQDWTFASGVLTRMANSRMPYATDAELYPASAGANALPKTGGGYILFRGDDSYWYDKQVVVTYNHAVNAWTGPVPAYSGSALPNTMSKLNGASPLKLVHYGDSISVGANTSTFARITPYLPTWGKFVARELELAYGSSVNYANASVGGQDSLWGKNNAATLVAAESPDLVILAFGMNDGTATSAVAPATFKSNVAAIIDTVRATKPQAEFILVGTMLANAEAANFSSLQAQYMAVLNQLATEKTGVAAADMTGVHQTLLSKKYYRDMTGNNVNHPNDFLSRWYGQFVKGMLVP